MTAKLETRKLDFSYRRADGSLQPVLRQIDLTVEPGELVCIVGVSGVGKTSLFNLMAGLELPDSGQVFKDGAEITGQKGQIAYMQQKDLLLPWLSTLDNVCLPLTLQGVPRPAARAQAQALLAEFGLQNCIGLYPAQLSGGMRQRAALLRSWLCGSDTLLLDEPFSALDAITRGELQSWLWQLVHEHSLTAVFITHDLDEAILLADRICIISGIPGQITACLPVSRPADAATDFCLTAEFLDYKRRLKALLH